MKLYEASIPEALTPYMAEGFVPWAEVAARVRQDRHRRVQCPHGRTAQRYVEDRGGRRRYRLQCLDCGGCATGAKSFLSRLEINRDEPLTPWDETIRERHFEAERARYQAGMDAERDLWRAYYEWYLSTPRWASLREVVMARARGRCERCGQAAEDVHHFTYRNLGAESPDELAALCRFHHREQHARVF